MACYNWHLLLPWYHPFLSGYRVDAWNLQEEHLELLIAGESRHDYFGSKMQHQDKS